MSINTYERRSLVSDERAAPIPVHLNSALPSYAAEFTAAERGVGELGDVEVSNAIWAHAMWGMWRKFFKL